MSVSTQGKSVDYGQDAPGVRLGMFCIGAVGLGLLCAGWVMSIVQTGVPTSAIRIAWLLGGMARLYGGWMGSYMTWSSRVGKLRTRDKLLDHAGRLRPWRGDEVVVDIGCGRGLMLIGAAKRLDRGTAIGIDLWRAKDQSATSPETALANANDEGVSDRVRIETGDARNLPLADESVDVALSHWVIHNIPEENDRKQALNEMWRVLRPGGVLVLADINHVPAYRHHLLSLGAARCDFLNGGSEALIMGFLSGGTYRPQALVCSKG